MPMRGFGDDEADRRLLRNAAEIFEIEQFGETLEISRVDEPDIVDGAQGYFDDRAHTQLFQIIMCEAEVGLGHGMPRLVDG